MLENFHLYYRKAYEVKDGIDLNFLCIFVFGRQVPVENGDVALEGGTLITSKGRFFFFNLREELWTFIRQNFTCRFNVIGRCSYKIWGKIIMTHLNEFFSSMKY